MVEPRPIGRSRHPEDRAVRWRLVTGTARGKSGGSAVRRRVRTTDAAADGYSLIGPSARDGAIVYDEIAVATDLPVGLTDEQDGGHYRLVARDDRALFGYAVGPHSFKRYQLPADVTVWSARVDERGGLIEIEEPATRAPRYAFIGARSCELHAMGILDRVLLGGVHPDPADRARREDVFIVAVQCGEAGGTCFCVSMGTLRSLPAGSDVDLPRRPRVPVV